MFKKLPIMLSLFSLSLVAEEVAIEMVTVDTLADVVAAAPEVVAASEFEAFTGKVTKGKVRLRATPTIDGFIVQELQKGDLLLVDGEQDGFYKVRSPEKVKGYVFRTFILDGKVEGSRVNVRLAPDLEAPVIAQLNNGDTLDGHIFANNTKWIECTPPSDVRFYVAAEYIEKAGDVHFIARCEERKTESAQILSCTIQAAAAEFDKKFDEMDIEPILSTCQSLLNDYSDCQEVVHRAKELQSQVNADYLARKISYLEGKAMQADMLATKLSELEPSLREISPKLGGSPFPLKLTSWQDVEQNYIAAFKKIRSDATEEDFYKLEKEKAIHLTGVLTPYLRPVKNKPGDYLLLDPTNNHPVAYLYSTKINLQDELGSVVKLLACPRPNNQFAYPAYYVLGVER